MAYKINSTTKSMMISIAVIFDIIEIIFLLLGGVGLVLNRILTVIEYMIYYPWFFMEGVDFSGKKGNAMSITFLTELIPVLGSLPGLTIGVYLTIKAHNDAVEAEEKDVNEQKKGSSKASSDNRVVRARREHPKKHA